MSSVGDDEPPSPSAYLEAPSSQSLIVDTQPFTSQRNSPKDESAVKKFQSDSEDSEDERENRFSGPANTWRKYTADERGLVASLDQERANDLSVHLYNAHALKSRLHDPETASKARSWHSKRHWIKPEQDGSIAWHPDQNWTAWPLRADDVPRKPEGFGKDTLVDDVDDGTLKMRRPWRAGNDLEEEIQALMLRKAKSRFSHRAWEAEGPSKQDVPKRSPSLSQMPSSPPIDMQSRQSSVTSVVHSQTSNNDVDEEEPLGKPNFITDDDEASRLMKQSARHVTSKLDHLLAGLHTSRHHHAAGSIGLAESTKRSKSNKRKRRSTADETTIKAAGAESDGNDGKPRSQERIDKESNSHPFGPHGLIPRDWSEVIGMASLTGWNPDVIDRAAKRCAALFGESMIIRSMPETAAGNPADVVKQYNPQMIPELDDSDEEAEEGEEGVATEEGLNCPVESCPQRYRFYEKRWQIRQHLKHTHKYTQEALDEYDRSRTLPSDAKPSIEELGEEDDAVGVNPAGAVGEVSSLVPAVDEDGFMEPVDLFLGRGTDASKRKTRLSKREP